MSSPTRKVLQSSENVSDQMHNSRVARKVLPNATVSSSKAKKQEPPKPPRSAFMCFTDTKKKEIMSHHGIVQDNDDILKIVAREWKALSDKDRAHWDEEARDDKVRFVRQKAAYKGPWTIPKRRAKKHPLAPKRPMSAFLKYSQTRRAKVKKDNPDMGNTDVSRLLGEMWRNASPKERAPYVEQEEQERAIYKENIKKWKDEQARMDAASRTSHHRMDAASHHSVQNYHHQPQGYERSYTSGSGSFENLHIDSFEEPTKKAFRQQYNQHPFPAYRQTFSSVSDLSLQRTNSDFHETDPLPVSRPPLPPPQMDEEDSLGGHYGTSSRSSYFPDNMSVGYYSRYP